MRTFYFAYRFEQRGREKRSLLFMGVFVRTETFGIGSNHIQCGLETAGQKHSATAPVVIVNHGQTQRIDWFGQETLIYSVRLEAPGSLSFRPIQLEALSLRILLSQEISFLQVGN